MAHHDTASKDNPVNIFWIHWMIINIGEKESVNEVVKYEIAYHP